MPSVKAYVLTNPPHRPYELKRSRPDAFQVLNLKPRVRLPIDVS